MKKVALALSLMMAMVWSTQIKAQDNFDKGTGVAQVTIGFPQLLGSFSYDTRIPAIAVAYDHCIIDGLIDGNASVGVGGIIGISGSKYDIGTIGGEPYGYKYTYILFGARGTFHYQWIDGLDTYAGVLLAGYAANGEYYGRNVPFTAGPDSGGAFAGAFAGAKYYFTDNLSVLGEVGYGIAVLNVGLGFKF
jgi:hypothetical protein